MKRRWHVWATLDGNVIPPRPVDPELWRKLRSRPCHRSGCGNWREYTDENGDTTLVLVRLGNDRP